MGRTEDTDPQLTALPRKKDINLEVSFHCQLSIMLFPAPSVAPVKWHPASYAGPYAFIFISLGLFILCHQEKLFLPFSCLPASLALCRRHQMSQIPGLVTRHPEHGAGAQPGAVTQTGPKPGTLAPCQKISPSLRAAPRSPCCDSQLDGLSVFTESPGAPATPCPPQACAVCPTLPTNSISFVIKNSCNLIRWRSQLQNEGSH